MTKVLKFDCSVYEVTTGCSVHTIVIRNFMKPIMSLWYHKYMLPSMMLITHHYKWYYNFRVFVYSIKPYN
jgi:hypothetical protein